MVPLIQRICLAETSFFFALAKIIQKNIVNRIGITFTEPENRLNTAEQETKIAITRKRLCENICCHFCTTGLTSLLITGCDTTGSDAGAAVSFSRVAPQFEQNTSVSAHC